MQVKVLYIGDIFPLGGCGHLICGQPRFALQTPDLSIRLWNIYGECRIIKSCRDDCRRNLEQPQKISMSVKDIQPPGFHRVLTRSDQDYWAVAWLRAECHWEGRENERYAENYRRKFAEQEFNDMRKRYNTQLGDNTKCIVMVNEEDKNVKGTLDLSFHHFSPGQTFPGEYVKPPIFCLFEKKASGSYAFIASLCVAKSARRQGIAGRMLQHAILSAQLQGAEKMFVHFHRNNKPAQSLYQKMGFKVVDAASSRLSADHMYLLLLGLGPGVLAQGLNTSGP